MPSNSQIRIAFNALLVCLLALLQTMRAESVERIDPSCSRTWEVGGKLKITAPQAFEEGVPFRVTLDFLELPAGTQRVNPGFSYLGKQGAFRQQIDASATAEREPGQRGPLREINSPGKVEVECVVNSVPEDLEVLLLTVFLSPDGNWKGRTLQAVIPIRPATGGDPSVWARAEQQAAAQTGVPPNPEASVEDCAPRSEYFTQRMDDPEARGWKVAPQDIPPLDKIIQAAGNKLPPYGVYSWVQEYERAAAEVAKIGIRSLRLAGPWQDADEAMKLAAQNGVEVLFTLRRGPGQTAYKQRLHDFPNEEEFLRAFQENVSAFVKRYGPGGEFEKTTGLKSPLAVVEMWNEPNFFYMIDDQVYRAEVEAQREALYPKVLRVGYETSKAIAPDLQVAGFAAGGADMADIRFIERILRADPEITRYFDILSTHPYNKGAPPEGERVRPWGSYSIANALAKIRAALAEASAEKPVWYTELGWHFAGKHGGQFSTPVHRMEDTITPDLHAAYVTRMFIWALRLGVPRVYIMHLHDADAFNSGFLNRSDLAWRPAAHATKTMIDLLPNPKIVGALSDGDNNTYAYTIKADHSDPQSAEILYAWNTLGPQKLEVPTQKTEVEISDMVGNRKVMPSENGTVVVEVGPYPIYIFP